MDCCQIKSELMLSQKLALNAPGPKLPLWSQGQYPVHVLLENFTGAWCFRSAAFTSKPFSTFSLISSPPLSEGRSRNPATPAHEASIVRFFAHPHPGETLSYFSIHSHPPSRSCLPPTWNDVYESHIYSQEYTKEKSGTNAPLILWQMNRRTTPDVVVGSEEQNVD